MSNPDAILTLNDTEEALSKAYAYAVAASAGYVVSEQDFDRDGVDIQFNAGGDMRPRLDAQLKASKNCQVTEKGIAYPMKVGNYNLLRERTQVPRIAILLDLPDDHADWISVTSEELSIRRCAYWTCLTGMPETSNTYTINILFDHSQIFDKVALGDLMERSRNGEI